MSTTIVQAVGNPSSSTGTSFVTTIASSGSGNILTIRGTIFTDGGGETVSSNGTGTWTSLISDLQFGSRRIEYYCLNPGAGTTTITVSNGATASHYTMCAIELSGADTGQTPTATATNLQSTITAWTTTSATSSGNGLAIASSHEGSNGSSTSTAGGSFTVVSGTGITSGNIANSTEGDVLFVEKLSVAAGSVTATGTWSAAVSPFSWEAIYYDASAPPPPPPPPPSGPGFGQLIFVTAKEMLRQLPDLSPCPKPMETA